MSNDQSRRSRDSGSAGSPMGSTAAIIIAIVAVVAGFLILRQIRSDDSSGSAATLPPTTIPLSTQPSNVTVAPTIPIETTPTTVAPVVDGATVVVANASTVNGAAGVLTTALTGKGFTMAKATNATAKQDLTTILYDASNTQALPVATYLASLMGNPTVQEVTTPAPVQGGLLPEGVSILVMLGSDKANSTLDQMSGVAAPGTTVAAAGGTTGTTTG
jgi:LytR cell envelope-related transcriptional attenuator